MYVYVYISYSFYFVIGAKMSTNYVTHKMPIFQFSWASPKVPNFRKIINLPSVSVPLFQSMFIG